MERIGYNNEKGKKYSGHIQWFLFLCLLWVLAYPVYFYHRKRYGMRNLLGIGIVVAVVFSGSFGFLGGYVQTHSVQQGGAAPLFALLGAGETIEFDSEAKSELFDIQYALESFKEKHSHYPESMQELFPILDEMGQSQSRVFFILDFGKAYQVASFHEEGTKAFVCSDDQPQIVPNPLKVIADQIEKRFKVVQEYGNYQIIE